MNECDATSGGPIHVENSFSLFYQNNIKYTAKLFTIISAVVNAPSRAYYKYFWL